MTHRLNLLLLVLAAVLGLPWYWLLLDNPPRDQPPQPIHLADLRRLADTPPGPRPDAIEATVVGWDRTPGTLLAAGAGVKRRLYSVISFRLAVPGRGPIVIDTGTTAPLATALQVEGFNASAQQLVDADLAEASLVLATSESPDALGGLADFARRANAAPALAHVRLDAAQDRAAMRAAGRRFAVGAPIAGAAPQAVAPGVVVIPARSPTPGSQMVYVRLASGREYVFAGAVAPYAINAAELRTRSRLLDLVEGRQDRAGAMRWLVTLRQWRREAPGLFVVPGNDIMALGERTAPSGIGNREPR
ncbi:hypothetical protein ACFOD9_10470 [Novosphingobium bradum]|uniref:MBL fold metallo-hydrolase n=1 Tax=Novosphingobium bradum TaxID=1737444 RepID=A0ABV7IRT1_9SPHN